MSKVSSPKLTKNDIYFTTLGAATLNEFVRLVAHVATLNEQQDKEEPVSYLGWMLQHALGYTYEQGELAARLLLGFTVNSSSVPDRDLAAQIFNGCRPPSRPANYLPPHQIYLAFDRQSHEILDIAGFVPDDRGVGKMQGLAIQDPRWIGFFGGHNVSREHRGRGVGRLMIAHRIDQAQKYVDQTGQEATVYTFLTNEVSGKLLVDHGGFEYVGVWHIHFFRQDEHVFRRVFCPQQ